MGRSPCCDKVGLKKGPWTPEEDQKLLAYIEEHGHGSWRALPAKADLQRCGKSCRLRWTNYLRPDIKRGKFSLQEEQTIIQLHALLGNRWSAIATHIPKRTDNEIKNYWNTHLKKRLTKMGIDPVTHKPKNESLLSPIHGGQSKNAANLSHMAQWESARLEAEARLVRESKLRSHFIQLNINLWDDLESPISTLTSTAVGSSSIPVNEIINSESSDQAGIIKEEGELQLNWTNLKNSNLQDCTIENNSMTSFATSSVHDITMSGEDGFTSLLLNDSLDLNLSGSDQDSKLNNSSDGNGDGGGGGRSSDYYEDNKNYWNSILNLVDSSIAVSPMF